MSIKGFFLRESGGFFSKWEGCYYGGLDALSVTDKANVFKNKSITSWV